jgi:hypothetical protein
VVLDNFDKELKAKGGEADIDIKQTMSLFALDVLGSAVLGTSLVLH